MRNKIVAGNWKMNLLPNEANQLFHEISENTNSNCQVYAFVPSIYLAELASKIQNNVFVGAQNAYYEDFGAFTGEVSMKQIKATGAKAVLIGHSERRSIFLESNELLKLKVDAALKEGLEVFFCCGETLDERESNQQEEVILKQLQDSLFHLSVEEIKNVVIAYEPVWAIGTGKTASKEQANEVHQFIRKELTSKYGEICANNVSILYGGSCNPSNAKDLFSQSDIDGGLIGGASLKSKDFLEIQNSF